MTQHNTCLGGEAMRLLGKTNQQMHVLAKAESAAEKMLTVWNAFAAKAKGQVDAAEAFWDEQRGQIETYEEANRASERAARIARREAVAFLDRVFAGDLTPEDYHLALTKGWPVELLKPRRISA